ncbi:14089_t:CDS:2 [Entrophospora sp. SA101]|nr:14084_t:CDS:2 [Entrophospora sp. SA101]CAJ0927464.1 14089_t:CDS:2 [Entrophospora sp. SA101]
MSEATYTATWIAPEDRMYINLLRRLTGKCDGVLFVKNSMIERLVFEKLILIARGSGLIGKGMWKFPGNISRNQGGLWRVCLAGKDKYIVERIYKLEILWKFEDDWTKLADICKMLLLIEVPRFNESFSNCIISENFQGNLGINVV